MVNYTKYVIRTRARFRLTTHLLECGATEPNAVRKGESHEKGISATTARKRCERAAGILHR
jgi:hypothetical protein